VVRREVLPNSRTDLFSMAVLFFYILFSWHPLDGRREAETTLLDGAAETRLYGTEPLFLFDPDNDANGPVPGFHDPIVARWQSLPAALRRLFVRAFTTGLNDPSARVLETEWRPALRAVIDASLACIGCGFEQVIDYDRSAGSANTRCIACNAALDLPSLLIVSRRAFALSAGRSIDGAALDPAQGEAARIGAEVEAHPTKPGVIGLKNLTAREWQVTLPDNRSFPVPPGQSIRIVPGASIGFGTVSGRIADLEGVSA
jgi:eukaryotic-like serine/threonine-protein kinase